MRNRNGVKNPDEAVCHRAARVENAQLKKHGTGKGMDVLSGV